MTDTQVSVESQSKLTYRWRPPQAQGALNFLMFHGLTGNEDVMWILETTLPSGGLIAAPRAPYELPGERAFSWVPPEQGDGFQRGDFDSGVSRASQWIRGILDEHQIPLEETVFVGFSQGAALSFMLADRAETRPAALVALAGFLPGGNFTGLEKLPVFWGHGSQDETVPVERAKGDIKRLKEFRAEVHYCQADVGHKVGAECLRGLKNWLQENAVD